MRLKSFPPLAALLATMALAAPAFAQTSPATQVYGGDVGEVLDQTVSSTPDDVVPPPAEVSDDGVTAPSQPVNVVRKTAPKVSTGSLPFTGFEAGLVALVGVALLGTGFALRRTTRRTTA